MKLYDTQRSGNAWKVRLLASYLGIPLMRHTLSIDRGDFRELTFTEIAPFRQVPLLQLDNGGILAESTAILHYLAQGSKWWPSDVLDQSSVLMWMSFEQEQHMPPLAQLRLRIALHNTLDVDSQQSRELSKKAVRALEVMERQLLEKGSQAWIATNECHPTIADIALYPYTCMASMGGIVLSNYPAIQSWLHRMEKLPRYEALFPGRPDLNLSVKENI